MEEKHKLKDENLSKVAGGATDCDNKSFSGHTAQHDAVQNAYYFCVKDGTNSWFAGQCLVSWEETFAVFFSKRTHKIRVINKGSCSSAIEGTEKDIRGESWTLFSYMNERTVKQCYDSKNWK